MMLPQEQAGPSDQAFSLTEGGPTYRLMTLATPRGSKAPLLVRQAWIVALALWVPLLVFSEMQGVAVGGAVTIPFLWDFAAHARLLVAVPILLFAEGIVGPRLRGAMRHFILTGLVPEERRADFEAAIRRGIKLRDSVLAEAALLGLAYAVTLLDIGRLGYGVTSWQSVRPGPGSAMTMAAWWYALVCIPFTQFLMYRWLYRVFIWSTLLRRISKLDLDLVLGHPDEAGGLGFLGDAHAPFALVVFALASILSGTIAVRLAFEGASLQLAAFLILTFAVMTLVIFIGPLLLFTPKLAHARRAGKLEYGALAASYHRAFNLKWTQGREPETEPMLGSPDFQSLADMGNGYRQAEQTRAAPFRSKTAMLLLRAALLPQIPLILTRMPVEDVLKGLFKMLV